MPRVPTNTESRYLFVYLREVFIQAGEVIMQQLILTKLKYNHLRTDCVAKVLINNKQQ